MTSIPTARVTIPIRIFVPKPHPKASFSILIDGTEQKTKVTKWEVTKRVTTGVSEAVITLANISKEFFNKYFGGEIIEVKADYVDGTTTIFKGYLMIAKPAFSEKYPKIVVTAFDYGYEAMNRFVTKKYTTATDIGEIAAAVIGEYLTGHTTTNINQSTGITATPTWQEKSLWECLKDLAVVYGENGYDFYCDENKDWHFFAKGSRIHDSASGVAIVYGQNLDKTTIDQPFINKRNRIKVIGKNLKGQMLMATRDAADQTPFIMEEPVRDTNLTTLDQVKNMANLLIIVKGTTGKNGTCVNKKGELNLLAGYQAYIWDPYNGLSGYYGLSEVKHETEKRLVTTVKFYEYFPSDLTLVQAIKNRFDQHQQIMDIENEHGLENSFPVFFDDTSQMDTSLTSSNVTVSNGRLTLASGESGTFVSVLETARKNTTKGLIKVSGSDLEDCSFGVSIDNYSDVKVMVPRKLYDFDGSDKRIRVVVTLQKTADRRNPSVESIGFEYT